MDPSVEPEIKRGWAHRDHRDGISTSHCLDIARAETFVFRSRTAVPYFDSPKGKTSEKITEEHMPPLHVSKEVPYALSKEKWTSLLRADDTCREPYYGVDLHKWITPTWYTICSPDHIICPHEW